MRRAALAAAFLGLIGTGLGCKATFGRCDCLNDPSCAPLPAYANPSAVVGPTQSGATVTGYPVIVPAPGGPPAVIPPSPSKLPDMNIPVPVKELK